MTHKRSFRGREQAIQRYRKHIDIQEERRKDWEKVWTNAVWDEEVDEVANIVDPVWIPIVQGELLQDARGQGYLQRRTSEKETVSRVFILNEEYNRVPCVFQLPKHPY